MLRECVGLGRKVLAALMKAGCTCLELAAHAERRPNSPTQPGVRDANTLRHEMLHALSNYLYDRRSGLVKAASYAGGVYVVSQYVSERLGDVREKVVQDRQAREK